NSSTQSSFFWNSGSVEKSQATAPSFRRWAPSRVPTVHFPVPLIAHGAYFAQAGAAPPRDTRSAQSLALAADAGAKRAAPVAAVEFARRGHERRSERPESPSPEAFAEQGGDRTHSAPGSSLASEIAISPPS